MRTIIIFLFALAAFSAGCASTDTSGMAAFKKY